MSNYVDQTTSSSRSTFKYFNLSPIGLDKLNQTEVEVKELQIELAELKPLMEKAAEETRMVIQQIATDTVSFVTKQNFLSPF